MLNENKKPSVEYWNNTAKSWKDDAYSPDGNLTVFPSSEVRNKVVIKELINLGQQDAKILDIGCADGKLIRDMLHAGFTCVKGVDNSEKMITEAKKLLKEDFPDLNPDGAVNLRACFIFSSNDKLSFDFEIWDKNAAKSDPT